MTPRQQSILIGAVVTGILSTSYLFFINVLCCLGVIIGGVVATQQYTSRTGGAVESGDGAVLGALAGAGGAILQPVLNWALRPFGLGFRDVVLEMAKNPQGQSMLPPETLQQMQTSPGLGAILFNLVVGMVVYAIFGAIGGAIGAAIFGEEEPGQDVQPGGSQPDDLQSGGPEAGGVGGGRTEGGAQPGPSGGPHDESAGGSESNREGSV